MPRDGMMVKTPSSGITLSGLGSNPVDPSDLCLSLSIPLVSVKGKNTKGSGQPKKFPFIVNALKRI